MRAPHLHALLRQRPRVLDAAVGERVDDAARAELLAEAGEDLLGVLVVGLFRGDDDVGCCVVGCSWL